MNLGLTPGGPYWPLVYENLPRLLGTLDRERLSPTCGSFDRDHWAWKFRDFPLNMLQVGTLPLAWMWRHDPFQAGYGANAALLRWIVSSVETTLGRQHRSGAFDGTGPNTQDHGITLAQAYAIDETLRLLGDSCPRPLQDRAHEALARAAHFAERSSEDYAFISNHQALFALTWLRLGTRLGAPQWIARSDGVREAIVAQQSPDGWYTEYGGPDPGYESLGIHYLAQLARERPHAPLEASLARALEFLSYMVQPDGTLGGGTGSRHTVQWYPAGFELLAHQPRARSIAGFLRGKLSLGTVVTPRTVDVHNAPFLLYSYCLAGAAYQPAALADRDTLPCERHEGMTHFRDSGVVVVSTDRYYAVVNLKMGGSWSAVEHTSHAVYEDAGYVAKHEGRQWATCLPGLSASHALDGETVSADVRFGAAPRPVLTPFKFLVLRLLNLTLFRSVAVGAAIRRLVIAQLVTGRKTGPLSLRRRVKFLPETVEVADLISGGDASTTALWRPTSFAPLHMGSARYFHPRDLKGLPDRQLASECRALAANGEVSVSFRVVFGDGGHVEVVEP